MGAYVVTVRVYCDHFDTGAPDGRGVCWESLDLPENSLAKARTEAAHRGWTVGVRPYKAAPRTVHDFCPKHKPEARSEGEASG